MDWDVEEELFLVAIREAGSLAGEELELAEVAKWMRQMARKGAEAHEMGGLRVMETHAERLAWAQKQAVNAVGFWGPEVSDTNDLPAAHLRMCAELRTWDAPGLPAAEGPLHEVAAAHVAAVIEAVLFAFAGHIAEHFDW